jgi:hypothetical protein
MKEQLRKLAELVFIVASAMMILTSYVAVAWANGMMAASPLVLYSFWISTFTSPAVFFAVMACWKYQWPIRVNWFVVALGMTAFTVWMWTSIRLIHHYGQEGILTSMMASAFAVPAVLASVLAITAVMKSFKDQNSQPTRNPK